MKRLLVFFGVAAVGLFLYLQLAPTKGAIAVTDARAMPMGASGKMFMVSLTMRNEGAAVALIGASSPSGAKVSLMNPENSGPLIIPAKGQGHLAMDGAHMMLTVPKQDFEEGTFKSVSLDFDDGTSVVARVLRPAAGDDSMGGMHHGAALAVEATPSPILALTVLETPSSEGFEVGLGLENFEFLVAADDAEHVPNQGHAHVYLNGLKLGRLYEDTLRVGGLKSGDYSLRIGLFTNDHRPYGLAGDPVEAVYTFSIP